jgi:hypothetical protein
MKAVKLLVFKELVDGDLRKFRAESNDAATGGGARDLRFRPYERFDGVFERLFPAEEQMGRRRGKGMKLIGVRKGMFHWHDAVTNQVHSREARFEPPTDARPNEGRISTVHHYPPLQHEFPTDEGRLVFLMIQDVDGAVWPFVASEQSLRNDEWDELVAKAILECLDAPRSRPGASQGYVDVQTGARYCND